MTSPTPADNRAPSRKASRHPIPVIAAVAFSGIAVLVIARSCSRPKSWPGLPPGIASVVSAFPPVGDDLPPAAPLEPLIAAEVPDRLAVVEPESEAVNVPRGAPIELRFNRPMVAAARIGKPADKPAIVFTPPVRTRQTWTGRGTLQVQAEDSTWQATRTAKLELASDLRSASGEAVEEFEPKTVVFDATPRYGGRKSSRVLPGEPVRLFFEGKVAGADLPAKMLVYEVGAGRRMIPFSLTERPRDDKGRIAVDLLPRQQLPPGAHLAVALAPILTSSATEPRVIDFELSPRPSLEGIGCPPDADAASQCEFQGPPGKILDIGEALVLLSSAELKEVPATAFAVSPALPNLAVSLQESKRISLRGDWDPGQVYKVSVTGLRDADGHPLSRFSPLAVRSEGRAPAIEAPSGHLVFERDARPELRFRAIHVESGAVRWTPVAPGNELIAASDPLSLLRTDQPATWTSLPLQPLAASSRPNRWGSGRFAWYDADPAAAPLAVISLVPDPTEGKEDAARTSFVQWTDLGIDARVIGSGVSVWVTSIAHATPIAGASITIVSPERAELGSATSDPDGVGWIPLPSNAVGSGVIVRAVHGQDRAVLQVDPRRAMGPHKAGVTPGEEAADAAMPSAAVFVDRGMCRPGETIHVKAIARSSGQDPKAISGKMELRVFAPSTTAPLARADKVLDGWGAASADFPVEQGREPGEYRIEAWMEPWQKPIGFTTFRVGEYRAPAFRVDLDTESDGVVDGEPVRATIQGAWPFGSPAAGINAHWALTREGEQSVPDRWVEYLFAPADASSRWGVIEEGDAVLDPAGKAVIESRMALSSRRREQASLEVTLRDPSGQTASARASLDAWPAQFEIGVREGLDWVEQGAELDVESIVIRHDGAPEPGRGVEARIVREGWHSWWQWSSRAHKDEEEEPGAWQARRARETTVVHRCRLTSSQEPVHCEWKADRAGTYLLEATTRDDHGKTAVASTRVYVAGPDEHPDRDAPGSAISLTPAKSRLEVGDTAEIAFESPFPEAEALVRVERRSVLRTERKKVIAGGNVLRFPITPDMIPNAFVSLTLVRPRTGPPEGKVDLHAPDLRIGSTELTVRPKASPLEVKLTVPQGNSRAGQEVPIEVRVTDAQGAPASCQVALYAVDEGTLRITNYTTPDPSEGFFPRLGASFVWEDIRRLLVSRIEQPITPGPGGDGGGDSGRAPRLDDRERFEPTPLWLPSLETGKDGIARARLRLPDRPTEYRVTAIANDQGTRTGSAQASVIATRPVIIRPVVPPFLTAGDRFDAVAFLHSTVDRPLDASASVTVDGAADEPRAMKLEGGREQRVARTVEVGSKSTIRLLFRAQAGGELTEVQREIPVRPRARRSGGQVTGRASASQPIRLSLPTGAGAAGDALDLVVASLPFVGVDAQVESIAACAWHGTEQLASAVLAYASFLELDPARLGSRLSQQELRARAERRLDDLLKLQSPIGGFGMYASGSGPDPYLSAWALRALAVARKAGWTVPEESLSRLTKYLGEQVAGTAFLDGSNARGPDDLAFALRALAEVSAADTGRIQAVFDQRERLTPFGLAQLAMAMSPTDKRRVGLVQDAVRRVLATRDDERRDRTLLRWYDTSARTLGSVLEAASTGRPAHPDAGRLAGLLIASRGDSLNGMGASTHESAYAIAGLAAFGRAFGGNEPLRARVTLDGKPLEAEQKATTSARFRIPAGSLEGGSHELLILPEGNAFFSLAGRWAVPLEPADAIARGRTVALHRTFETEAGQPLPDAAHVRLGELVRVRLFVYTDKPAPPFLSLRDPLAGGLEALDASLETSPRDALNSLLGLVPGEELVDPRGHLAIKAVDDIARRAFEPQAAVFELEALGEGVREYTYAVRASVPGTFTLPPAELQAAYEPSFAARSAMASLTVDP